MSSFFLYLFNCFIKSIKLHCLSTILLTKKLLYHPNIFLGGVKMLNEKEFLRLISVSIRKRRLASRISSEKLSELSGMDYSSINLIENQKQNPRSYSLYKLLFALDIDITKDLKEDLSQQDVKDKIIRKLNLMTDSQRVSLLKLIDNFEISAK